MLPHLTQKLHTLATNNRQTIALLFSSAMPKPTPSPRPFSLTTAIRSRRALRFAARYTPLPFSQRMTLAKAEKTISTRLALN